MKVVSMLLPALIALGSPSPSPTSAATAPAWSDYPPLQAIERSTVQHDGHRLDVLVRRESEQRSPVLVLVPGSVCMPAFMVANADGKTELTTSAVLPSPAIQSAMACTWQFWNAATSSRFSATSRPKTCRPCGSSNSTRVPSNTVE
jgi:hypothetical protein